MASAVYPKWKEAAGTGAANSSLTTAGQLKAVLVDTATYTYSATHQFFSDLTGVVGSGVALGSPSFTSGVLNATSPTTFSAVSGASVEAVVLYLDNGGANTTWRLVAYIDGLSPASVTPNGGDINITWDTGASKIFAL